MRLVRLFVLATALTAPLGGQDVTRTSSVPLTASLHFTSYEDLWFESNQPAYFAVFELTHDRLVQLHPYWKSDRTQAASTGYARGSTLAGRPNLYLAQRSLFNTGLVGDGYGYASYGPFPNRFETGELHTLLLVASRMPLRIGSPMDAFSLQIELSRRGHSFDLDRDSGIDALVTLITDGASDADVAVDLLPVDPRQLWYASSAYGMSYGSLYCTHRFSSVYDWFPWQFSDYYCNPFFLNPWLPPVPPPQPAPGPQRVTETLVPVPIKLVNEGNATSNPEEIRRILARLREYDAPRATGFIDRTATPGMAGAEANHRQPATEARRSFSMPSAPTQPSTPYTPVAGTERPSMPDRVRPHIPRPTEGVREMAPPRFSTPYAAPPPPPPPPPPAPAAGARPEPTDPKKP